MKSMKKLTKTHSLWTELAYVVAGAVLLIAASKILIPWKPVPVTLQPTAVLLLALVYKNFRAIQSVLLWIGMGALGLPVFASWEPGFVTLAGPTAGYIMSYIFVTLSIPYLRDKWGGEGWLFDMLLCAIATVINFTFGVVWLSGFVGLETAISLGLLPFIIPGLVKACLLCGALKAVRSYKESA